MVYVNAWEEAIVLLTIMIIITTVLSFKSLGSFHLYVGQWT